MNRKIGIICAGDREFEPFIKHIENDVVSEQSMLKIHQGIINGVEVVALYSGVCKVNAAIATQVLIGSFGAEIIINAGTAGGMDEQLEVFDTVISTEAAYHDVFPAILTEFHPWLETEYFKADQKLVELSKIAVKKVKILNNVVWGRTVTGEKFIAEDGRKEINEKYSPLIVDMETASIAHVCYVNEVPFLSVRCITDTAKYSGNSNFEKNCGHASEIAKDITLALLEEIRCMEGEWE